MAKPRTLANTVADGGPLATPGEVDLPGGVQGSVPYQSAPNQTALLAPGTAGHVLTSGGPGANPTWAAAVTSPAGTTGQVQINDAGAFGAISSGTSGQALVSQGAGAAPVFGTLGVPGGGTGQTSFTDGQLLIGNTTGNTLTKATLTAGTGINITNGAGSITISSSGGGGATGGTIYLANNFGGF